MKISYAVTVCNELVEIQTLINFLRENKRQHRLVVYQIEGIRESCYLIYVSRPSDLLL